MQHPWPCPPAPEPNPSQRLHSPAGLVDARPISPALVAAVLSAGCPREVHAMGWSLLVALLMVLRRSHATGASERIAYIVTYATECCLRILGQEPRA